MPNLKKIRFGKNTKYFDWSDLDHAVPIKRLDFPKKTREFRVLFRNVRPGAVKKVYVRAESLKEKVWWVKMPLGTIPEDTTFYVKNKKVKRQLRDMYGFQGKIIIKKKMKRYDKLK